MITDEQIIDDLVETAKKCESMGFAFTKRSYANYGDYGANTPIRRFGSWKQACIEAGLSEDTLYEARVRREKRQGYNMAHGEKIARELRPFINKYKRLPDSKRFRTALTISDVHDMNADPFTLRTFLDCVDRIKPDRLLLVGDIFDGTESNRFHKDAGDYRPVDRHRFVRDKIFKPMRELVPDAQIDFQLGNHELNFVRHIAESAGSMRDILQELHGMTLSKFLMLDEFEINLQSQLDFSGWTKRHDDNVLAQDILVVDDAFMVAHKPHYKRWHMPGVSGHVHNWQMWNVHRVVNGNQLVGQWWTQGAACRKKVVYCDPSHWQQGFCIVNWDNLKKYVQIIPVDTSGTMAYAAGKGYERMEHERLMVA